MRAPRLLLRLAGKAVALMALLVVFAAGTANAQDVCYVDTGGDDAQNGQTPSTAKETIDGCLNAPYVEDGTIISIEAGTYDDPLDDPVTVGEDLIFEARESGAFTRVQIHGGVVIAADVTFRQDTQAGTNGVFRVGDNAAGDLALDLQQGSSLTVENGVSGGRLRIPDDRIVQIDDEASVTGDVTYLGIVHLEYLDNDSDDNDVDAGGEFPSGGDFAGGSLYVDLENDNTLTIGTATGLVNLGAETGSTIDGTIVVDGVLTIDGGGNVGSLEVNDDVIVGSDVAVGDVNIANDDNIDFDLQTFMLTVNGDFVREGGVFIADAGSEIAFRGDDADATFGPGPNFEVGAVTIDKDGRTLDITEDVTVTESAGDIAFSVAEGSTARFEDEQDQVNIDADGVVDVDGTVTNLSTIVFRAANADLQGDGTYGDILVTAGGDITVGATTQEDVVFTGTLTLNSGGITVGGDDDLSPADGATVSVNLETAGQDIDGSFNDDDNDYNLVYTGDMDGNTRIVGTEFATDDLLNLTFNVENGTVNASAPVPDGTIAGNVTLNDIGAAYEVDFPLDVTIEGSLTVDGDATLDGTDVTLEGASNTVEGTISAATTLHLEDGVTLTGTSDDDFPATVGSVEANGTVSIVDIQIIDGDVTTNADADLRLGLADEMDITGNLVLDGDWLRLTSDVDVAGMVDANAGTLAFRGMDLNLDGDFDGEVGVTYTSTGGALVYVSTGILDLQGETLPGLILEAGVEVDLTSDAVISDEFSETGGAYVDIDAFDLTLGGDMSSDGGLFIGAAAGELTFETGTLTLDGDGSVDPPTTIADGATLEIEAADSDDDWTLSIIGGQDLMLNGAVVLNQNHLELLGGDLLNDGGAVTADGGEVIMGGGDIEVDGALSIANLTIDAATDLGVATDGDLTVASMLTLNAGLSEADDDDELIIGNGATIVINTATPLADVPDFAGDVSLVYTVVTDSGNEIPEEGEGTVVDVDVDAAVELQTDLTVNGTLALAAPIDNTTEEVDLVLASGATLSLEIDNQTALADADIDATDYTLEYAGVDDTITDEEFIAGATVTELRIDGVTIDNSLDGDGDERTINDLTIQNGGEFDLVDDDINVAGDVTMAGNDLTNSVGTAAFSFVGGASQMWMLSGEFEADDINVQLAKDDTSRVTLSGGDVDLLANAQTLFLHGGILETVGDSEIFLYQDNTTQGFQRSVDEDDGEVSHVAGNVTKFLQQGDPFGANRSARFEYPTGSPDGEYRPYVLTFRENVVTNTFITVNHEDENPLGTLGLPVSDDTGQRIGNYPDFYWLVDATTSLGQAQEFDVELTATEIGIPFTDDDDLRIIRRFDGDAPNNEWSVQGDAANYENFMAVDENEDTTAVVRVLSSSGGIVTQGARFTLGLPTRAPMFTNATDTLIVDEGEGGTFDFDADPQDLGETVTYSLAEGHPDWVSIDAQTGVLTAEPGSGDAGTYVVEVIADDGEDQTTHELTIIVRDVLNITPAIADTTISDGQTLAIDFDVTDVNPDDPVMWSLAESVDNAAIDAETGEFTFTPDFEQADSTYTFTISAENSTDSTGLQFTVNVEGDFMLGDVNSDGAMTLADVSLTLAAVIEDTTLSAKGEMAADVSGEAGVSAFDAALMLQCLAANGPTVEDTSVCGFDGAGKSNLIASADIAWGEGENTEGGVAIPVSLSGTVKNVYSVEVTADVDLTATKLESVSSKLPDDWQMAWKADEKTGTIRVAMFGATPINYEGEVVRFVFSVDENETGVNLQGDAFVNENAAVQLGSATVKEIPTEFALSDNYPNPFNPTTTFTYSLPEASHVTIEVYDVAGRLVQTLVNGEKEAGRYEVKWDGRNAGGSSVASGVYLYRINAESFTKVKTMMLVK